MAQALSVLDQYKRALVKDEKPPLIDFNNQEEEQQQQKKFKHVRLGKQKPAQALNIVVEDHKALVVYNPN